MPEEFPGLYGVHHILFLVIGFALLAVGTWLIKKYVKNEKTLSVVIRVLAGVLLLWIVINRVSVTAYQVKNDPEAYSWLNLIPYTFCGLASLVYSLALLFGKRNNIVLHFIVYFGFFGGLCTLFYPDFLMTQTFWDIRTVSGLVHHYLMVCLSVLTVVTGYFKPDFKKWYAYPVGYAFMMLLGLFELDALGFPEAMNIGVPLVGDLPVLTSWYLIYAVSTAVVFLISFFFGRKKKEDI